MSEEASNEQAQDETVTDQAEAQPAQELTWDSWLEQQDETVKSLLDSHTKGLKSALESERTGRKDLARRVAELSQQAETGTELRTQLDKLTGDLDSMNARQSFYEQAHGMRVVDLKSAFVLARESGLVNNQGQTDWKAFQEQHPYMFERAQVPRANAGSGTSTPPPAQPADMNELIRRKAGIRGS